VQLAIIVSTTVAVVIAVVFAAAGNNGKDSDGNKLWERALGGSGRDGGSVLVLPQGGFLLAGVSFAQTQDAGVALQRGYRTGYSDGYMAGYRDTIDSVARNYTRHEDYSRADRAYNRDYGALEDYQDGYKQGFETGYDTGYDRRSFEASLPTGLKRRGVLVNDRQTAVTETKAEAPAQIVPANDITTPAKAEQPDNNEPAAIQTTQPAIVADQTDKQSIVIIPRETELMLELQQDLDTERNREGDRFTARVAGPSEIAGATIEGHISKVLKPGRIKRRSELSLTFDRIILTDARWSNMSGTLIEVMPVKGDNISRVEAPQLQRGDRAGGGDDRAAPLLGPDPGVGGLAVEGRRDAEVGR